MLLRMALFFLNYPVRISQKSCRATIQNADQIVVLEKGHIVDQGTQAELLRRCLLYQKLWQAHIGAQGWAVTSGAKEGQ